MLDIKFADPGNPVDANAIVSLLNDYAQHPMGGGKALSEYTLKHLTQKLAARDDCVIILAVDSGKAVGLCNCFEGFSTFASKPLLNIHDVYVSASHRGLGIAAQMMAKAEQAARQRGCCKMTLEVLSKNEQARASYRASGYLPYQLDDQFGYAEFWQKNLDETPSSEG